MWILNYISYLPGRHPDEFESTRIIGDRQFRKAVDLFNKATEQLKGKIDYRHTYLDFSKLSVTLPKQGGGSEVVKTCPAAMGFAFAAGTTDGPGAFDFKQGDDQVTRISILYGFHIIFIRIMDSTFYVLFVVMHGLPVRSFFSMVLFRGILSGDWSATYLRHQIRCKWIVIIQSQSSLILEKWQNHMIGRWVTILLEHILKNTVIKKYRVSKPEKLNIVFPKLNNLKFAICFCRTISILIEYHL